MSWKLNVFTKDTRDGTTDEWSGDLPDVVLMALLNSRACLQINGRTACGYGPTVDLATRTVTYTLEVFE